MRLAEIKDGVVVNVIVADPNNLPEWATDWPEAGPAGPGWAYDGKTFTPPPEPDPDPEPIDQPPTPAQLQAAIEAVARAAGVTDQALASALSGAGLSRQAAVQPVEPGPVIGGRE